MAAWAHVVLLYNVDAQRHESREGVTAVGAGARRARGCPGRAGRTGVARVWPQEIFAVVVMYAAYGLRTPVFIRYTAPVYIYIYNQR